MCRIRWPAFLALLLVLLLAPAPALADEVDVLGGFGRGLDDLYNPKTVDYSDSSNPQQLYIDEYEPSYAPLTAPTPRVINDDNAIQVVTDSLHTVNWMGAGDITWLAALRYYFFINANMRNLIILTPIGLVFMWWGLRKSLRLISRVSKGRNFRI